MSPVFLEIRSNENSIFLEITLDHDVTLDQLNTRVSKAVNECNNDLIKLLNLLRSSYNDWIVSLAHNCFLDTVILQTTNKSTKQKKTVVTSDSIPSYSGKKRGRKPKSEIDNKNVLLDESSIIKKSKPEPQEVIAELLARQEARLKEQSN